MIFLTKTGRKFLKRFFNPFLDNHSDTKAGNKNGKENLQFVLQSDSKHRIRI